MTALFPPIKGHTNFILLVFFPWRQTEVTQEGGGEDPKCHFMKLIYNMYEWNHPESLWNSLFFLTSKKRTIVKWRILLTKTLLLLLWSFQCLRTLVGHTGGVWSSQMRDNIIISGSTDRTLKVWNAETGECIHTLYGHTSTVRCMHLHEKRYGAVTPTISSLSV